MAEGTEHARNTAPGETPSDLALRAMLRHSKSCRRCKVSWQDCPTQRALAATLRKARS